MPSISNIAAAVQSEEFQQSAKNIINAEMGKLVTKYGEQYKALIEFMATAAELSGVFHDLAGDPDAHGSITALNMVVNLSVATMVSLCCKQCAIDNDLAAKMAADVQSMRKAVREGMQVAAEVHGAVLDAKNATLQ